MKVMASLSGLGTVNISGRHIDILIEALAKTAEILETREAENPHIIPRHSGQDGEIV